MTAAPHLLRGYEIVLEALAVGGVHRPSQWWRGETARFYLSGRRRWVQCVGRGGGKTHEGVDVGITETLYSETVVPPSERHYYVHVSENKDEAIKTLRIYAARLALLGVPHAMVGDTIEIEGVPRGIRVLAARIGAVSGFRCFGWQTDEECKWQIDGVNPAAEIVGSIVAMTITHREARGKQASAPVARVGPFYELFAHGDSETVMVSHAPSWIANPDVITEADCIALEPDPRIRLREYSAVPQGTALAAFDETAVDRAYLPRDIAGYEVAEASLILDPSSGKSDAWSWAVVRYVRDAKGRWLKRPDGVVREWPDGTPREDPDWKPTGAPILQFQSIDSIEGNFWGQVSGAELVFRLVTIARREGIRHCHSDQRESLLLKSAIEASGLTFHEHPWTEQSKTRAVETTRRWLRDQVLWLPSDGKGPDLRRELLAFEERISPSSGGFSYGGRRAHDDLVALLLTTAMADASDRGLPMSPHFRPLPRGMGQNQILAM